MSAGLRVATAEERLDCRAAMCAAGRLIWFLSGVAHGSKPVSDDLLALARLLNVWAQEPARPVAVMGEQEAAEGAEVAELQSGRASEQQQGTANKQPA